MLDSTGGLGSTLPADSRDRQVGRFIALHPGDLLITGTPPSVGEGQKPGKIFLKPGGTMCLGITGLGEQNQRVVAFDIRGAE